MSCRVLGEIPTPGDLWSVAPYQSFRTMSPVVLLPNQCRNAQDGNGYGSLYLSNFALVGSFIVTKCGYCDGFPFWETTRPWKGGTNNSINLANLLVTERKRCSVSTKVRQSVVVGKVPHILFYDQSRALLLDPRGCPSGNLRRMRPGTSLHSYGE